MSRYGTPAAAGPREGPFAPDRRDWLRLLGGVAFAAGALVLVIRESDWSKWAQLLVVLVACALLYALAFAGRRTWPALQGWQSAFLVFAVLLLPIVLLEFVDAVGGTPGTKLNLTWVFALSGAVAVATALVVRAWWQMLIGAIYGIVAWIAVWSKILDNPSADTIRFLLILFAAILLLLALVVGRSGRPGQSDLITAAGLSAVVAGAISLAGLNPRTSQATDLLTNKLPRPTNGWNAYLLLVSLLLIAYAARGRTRGPGYVGATGLLIFIGLTGSNIVARLQGDDPSSVVGWPLILLIAGAALLILSFALPRGRGGIGTTELAATSDGPVLADTPRAPEGSPYGQATAVREQPAPPPAGGWQAPPPGPGGPAAGGHGGEGQPPPPSPGGPPPQ